MTEPELDPKVAAKLRAAAEQEPYPLLDDDARARVLQALKNEPVRARRFPWVNITMGVAAAALLLLMLRPASQPVCELPVVPGFTERTLDLGRYGRVVLDADADAQLSRSESCELEITLTRGTLAAQLQNLKPARLSVRTPLGSVEVRGTTFSVAVDRQLEVVLLEGAVVLRDEASTTELTPGNALTRESVRAAPRKARVQATQERKLRSLLAPALTEAPVREPVVAQEPAPVVEDARHVPRGNATELLAAAERERRAGELARARTLYREAGAASGPDAEVALLRWARLEQESTPQAALEVLRRYRARYGRKLERARLGAEASFLEVQVLDQLGRHDEANERTQELLRRYPDSPHARAAEQR
ncbi:MAG: FecR domain-containing protein [Polyangiales bacterium]